MLVVVTGRHKAESELKKFEASQESLDRQDGWRYFLEKTDLMAGMDPLIATQQRQSILEERELKALRDTTTPIVRPANHR